MFACSEPRSSIPARSEKFQPLPARISPAHYPLAPFLHSQSIPSFNCFILNGFRTLCATALKQPFSFQSLPHYSYRHGGCTPYLHSPAAHCARARELRSFAHKLRTNLFVCHTCAKTGGRGLVTCVSSHSATPPP